MAKRKRNQPALELTDAGTSTKGPAECLGRTFESEEARRTYFTQVLRERLRDPEFRKQQGFPLATDEDILRMSDPPFYTACPNPFLEDFVRCYGRAYDPAEPYQREPFAVDTSVGKTDALYKAHGYHTKVPHLAIVPSILHYTNPGDIVLDGFAGSGMTGVAAQWCGVAPEGYRKHLELEWKRDGRPTPAWGTRRAVLNDLSPAATYISAGYNLAFELKRFRRAAEEILDAVDRELGWMYETRHKDGRVGRIKYTVWSEVFTCPECSAPVIFTEVAVDLSSGEVNDALVCRSCRKRLRKADLERRKENAYDQYLRRNTERVKRVPVLIAYELEGDTYQKTPDEVDLGLVQRVEAEPIRGYVPVAEFPFDDMWEAPRLKLKGILSVHQLFSTRTLHVLSALWTRIGESPQARELKFLVGSQFANLSLLNRYRPQVSFPYNPLAGVYYVGSAVSEVDPFVAFKNKIKRIEKAFQSGVASAAGCMISTGTAASLPLEKDSVDYIFTDPPFGDNYPYAELNFLPEAWHGVFTDRDPEAIVDRAKKNKDAQRTVATYQRLMTGCFVDYQRVLKPGRWITVVFSNSHNAVWHALQEALGVAGFVVADVRVLDKQLGSFKQVTSSAVKQDLVISAYKPTQALASRFALLKSSEGSAWAFVTEHLRNVPVFVSGHGTGEVVAERTAQMLYDRMVAFHVQRALAVPISGSEFGSGLHERFAERDGMFFLSHQVAEYDRKRASIKQLKQLELFVTDESSAIRWVRQQLQGKPRRLQDLTPEFTKQLQAWERHEVTVELRDILEQNFVCFDGDGPVPPQIHQYLSSNFKDLRNLKKTDPTLVRKAKGCWYVPDAAKAGDLEKLRRVALLKEFQDYVDNPQKRLKLFRTEAVRAGFKDAYDRRDYDLIVRVAGKLPESVLQEDEQLLMYFDVASTRLGR